MEALCLAQPVFAGIAYTRLADVEDVAGVPLLVAAGFSLGRVNATPPASYGRFLVLLVLTIVARRDFVKNAQTKESMYDLKAARWATIAVLVSHAAGTTSTGSAECPCVDPFALSGVDGEDGTRVSAFVRGSNAPGSPASCALVGTDGMCFPKTYIRRWKLH